MARVRARYSTGCPGSGSIRTHPPPYVAGTFFRSPQHLKVIWD
ncbi:MAG: hypothetical protein NVSMB60_12210 [Mycobacterium sp.]